MILIFLNVLRNFLNSFERIYLLSYTCRYCTCTCICTCTCTCTHMLFVSIPRQAHSCILWLDILNKTCIQWMYMYIVHVHCMCTQYSTWMQMFLTLKWFYKNNFENYCKDTCTVHVHVHVVPSSTAGSSSTSASSSASTAGISKTPTVYNVQMKYN